MESSITDQPAEAWPNPMKLSIEPSTIKQTPFLVHDSLCYSIFFFHSPFFFLLCSQSGNTGRKVFFWAQTITRVLSCSCSFLFFFKMSASFHISLWCHAVQHGRKDTDMVNGWGGRRWRKRRRRKTSTSKIFLWRSFDVGKEKKKGGKEFNSISET